LRASFREAIDERVSSASRAPLPARIPLVAFLSVVALVELLLNRIVGRLIHLEPLALRSPLLRVVDGAGLFVFHLVSVLSVLLLGAALARVSIAGAHYRAGARLAFPLVGGVAVALAALGVVLRLPPTLVFHLHLSFAFLSLLVVLTTLAAPAPGGLKAGTALLFVAYLVRLAPTVAHRFSPLGGLVDATTVEWLNAGMLAVSAAASLCLLPRRSSLRGGRIASAVTWLLVCGAAILMRRDWETAARVAAYAFELDLPLTLWGQAIYLAALGFYVNTLLRLLAVPGVSRLRGYGLLLMGLGGLQLDLPYEVALALLGFLCLAESAVRPDGSALPREAFDELVRRCAGALGAPSATVTGESGNETVRVHAPAAAAHNAAVALRRRAGVVRDVEVRVGEVPEREPPFTLARRGAGRLGPRGDGEVVATGDETFDRLFVLRDRRSIAAQVLDDATRARLAALSAGWLAIWPQLGVRYHAAELGDPEMLPKLIELLIQLRGKTTE
jgi:hypothetical protein